METMWIRYVAVSSAFLGAGKVPSVTTVRESGAWHRLQLGRAEGVKHQLPSLAPWVRQGRGEEGEQVGRLKGHRRKHLGCALPLST